MTSIRKLLFLIATLVFAAFALPASADSGDKFSAVMSPTSPPAQAGAITFTATIKNLAKFDYLKSYTVTVPVGLTISGTPTASSGSVSVSGQVVSVNGTLVAYTKTTQLTVKATPAASLGCSPSALLWGATAKGGLIVNNEVFTLDSSSVLQTTVTPLCYTIGGTLAGLGASKSVVLQNNGGDNLTLTANGSFTFATKAKPGDSYAVTVLTQPSGQTCTVSGGSGSNVMANVTTVSVNCTNPITASAGANGSITPLGQTNVNTGTDQGYAITPAANYKVQDVLVDGVSVGAVTSYTFTNVQTSHTIAASFTPIHYTITASAGANGSVTPSGAVDVIAGTDQAFTFTPAPTYHVKDVLVDGVSLGQPAPTSYTFTNVQANHTIAASFVITNHGCGDLQTSQGPNVSALDPFADVAFTTPNQWGVRSGQSLDGSTTCPDANYVFTLAGNVASLVSDRPPGSPPGTAFKYVIVWPPFFLDTSDVVDPLTGWAPAGWSQKRPLLAWVKDDSGNPVFTPALFCPIDVDELTSYTTPALLDTLVPDIPNVEPFITLGATYPQYAPGQKAKMCVSQQGATSFGRSPPGTGMIQMQYWDKVIDLSDGFTKMP